MGQTADQSRLKKLLVSVVFVGLFFAAAKFIISERLSPPAPVVQSSRTGPAALVPIRRASRPTVSPKGKVAALLTRSNNNSMPLVDMNDRGDFLFLKSPIGADYREYEHMFNGKSVSSGRLPATYRWGLTPGGFLVQKVDQQPNFQNGRMNGGVSGWAFNEIRFFRRYMDDQSFIYVKTEQKKKAITTMLMSDKPGAKSKTYFTSSSPMSILEIDDKQAIWVKEALDHPKAVHDRLLKFTGNSHEEIPMPSGYDFVDRVAVTGPVVAASFGNHSGYQPIRSFVKSQAAWKELPIPSGFVSSYVQKVFSNGMILGFVTDGARNVLRQVVWKGDSITVLNDLPNWPKIGQFSIVTQATRNGDIYVRSVLNTETGVSDNYLLKISEKS